MHSKEGLIAQAHHELNIIRQALQRREKELAALLAQPVDPKAISLVQMSALEHLVGKLQAEIASKQRKIGAREQFLEDIDAWYAGYCEQMAPIEAEKERKKAEKQAKHQALLAEQQANKAKRCAPTKKPHVPRVVKIHRGMSEEERDRALACTGKMAYNSPISAYNALVLFQSRTKDGRLTSYECRYCGAFHIGHSKVREPVAVTQLFAG